MQEGNRVARAHLAQWWKRRTYCSTNVMPSSSAVAMTAASFWLPQGAAM